jgi:DNA-binding GntR family transcriptional regulator
VTGEARPEARVAGSLARGARLPREGTPATRAQRVHDTLRAELLAGTFPYGDRLTEEQLAERFETSRTPVREALRRLEAEGHVVRDRAGGMRPNPPRVSSMHELYEVRMVLEDLAVRSAAADPNAQLESLRDEWRELSHEDLRDEGPDFVHADESFHEGLARASGNRATERYIRDINERIRVLRIHDFTTFDRIVATVHEHLEIAEAASAGKVEAAAALMRVHVERSAAVVERRVGDLLARMFEEPKR